MFCPNCGKEVPDNVNFCPYCGAKLVNTVALKQDNTKQYPINTEYEKENSILDDELILEVHPSWWHYFWWFALSWIFMFLPIIVVVLNHNSHTFQVYGDRIIVKSGILSKYVKEIFISDIKTIIVSQGYTQRILGIGNLHIATAGTASYEINVNDIPHPEYIKEIIVRQIKKMRV